MTEEKKVWTGAKALRRFIVPIDSLKPFEGNPRRGDVETVRASLVRFGQTRPILVDASDKATIIAGHHVRLAAIEEGWTHIAVMASEFKSPDEARAYLLADNRSHDLGGYDMRELYAQMVAVSESDLGLDGTGYDDAYMQVVADDIAAMDEQAKIGGPGDTNFPPEDPVDRRPKHQCPSCGHIWVGASKPTSAPAE